MQDATRSSATRRSCALGLLERCSRLGFALAFLFVLGAAPASAVEFHVDTVLDIADDSPGDGNCATLVAVGPPTGFPPLPQLDFRCSLRGAIQEANRLPGLDRIVLPVGTFPVLSGLDFENDDAVGDLDVLDDLEVVGAGSGETTIDVIGGHGFDLAGHPAVFMSLQGAKFVGERDHHGVNGEGSGADTIELHDVVSRGWKIHAVAEDVTVTRSSMISGEEGVIGYLVQVDDSLFSLELIAVSGSEIVVSQSTFLGGQLGVLGDGSRTEINSSVFDDAWTGVRAWALDVSDSTFKNNDIGISRPARHGPDPESFVTNSTITGGGTGIYVEGEELLLLHVTVTENDIGIQTRHRCDAGPGPGGLLCIPFDIAIDQSIVALNRGEDCQFSYHPSAIPSESHTRSHHSLDSDGTCELDDPSDLPNMDPKLGPLADRGGLTQTHALAANSPAIDAGLASCGVPFDQRGVARPAGSGCDLGAYEYVSGTSCGLGFEQALLVPLLQALRRRRRRPANP